VATEEPLAFRVVRGGLFVAASSYFNILFGFLANLVLTGLLAPEAFGTFALAMFFFSLLNLHPSGRSRTGRLIRRRCGPGVGRVRRGELMTDDLDG